MPIIYGVGGTEHKVQSAVLLPVHFRGEVFFQLFHRGEVPCFVCFCFVCLFIIVTGVTTLRELWPKTKL